MTIPLLLAFLILHGLFTWARFAVFRIEGAAPRGVRLIELSATASIGLGAVLIARRGDAEPFFDGVAAALAVSSATLFAWSVHSIRRRQLTAAFSPDLPVTLLTHGPWRFIRHPFYLAYILAHALPLAASRSPWALPGLLWMGCIYIAAAAMEERKFVASPLGHAWHDYQQRTGRFLPRWQCWRAWRAGPKGVAR